MSGGEDAVTEHVAGLIPLKPVVFEILLALAEGRRHGYGIIQALRDRAHAGGRGGRIETGPLYRHLRRLLESGLIAERDEPPSGTADDERRTAYYELTTLGRAVLRAEARRLSELVRETRRLGFLPGRAR
jgi:DNA-binding PadR family transcriptional regulator